MRPLFISILIVIIILASSTLVGGWWVTSTRAPTCGDGVCDSSELVLCKSDCGIMCGDGICDSGEQTCKKDCGVCSSVVKSGEPADKLDVVFVAYNYNASSIRSFADNVNNFIYNDLLAVEPFSLNSGKFNFWRVDKVETFVPPEEGVVYGADSFAYMAKTCPAAADVYVVVDASNKYTPSGRSPEAERAMGFTGELPPSLAIPSVIIKSTSSQGVMAHEFAHALANLGDEYVGTRRYFAEDSWHFVCPNIDKIGCPKWCSGEINTSSALIIRKSVPVGDKILEQNISFSCYAAWQRLVSCVNNTDDISKCTSYAELDPLTGISRGTDLCNFGINCRAGTGCYWGAEAAINVFRSSPVSIMNSNKIEDGFNLISTEALLKELSKYTSGPEIVIPSSIKDITNVTLGPEIIESGDCKESLMNVGDEIDVYGVRVTLDNVGEEGQIVITVDGLEKSIQRGASEEIEGITVTVLDSTFSTIKQERSALLKVCPVE